MATSIGALQGHMVGDEFSYLCHHMEQFWVSLDRGLLSKLRPSNSYSSILQFNLPILCLSFFPSIVTLRLNVHDNSQVKSLTE